MRCSENKIGDDGATAFAKAISAGTKLTSLDLSPNEIGDEGARVSRHDIAARLGCILLKLAAMALLAGAGAGGKGVQRRAVQGPQEDLPLGCADHLHF